MMPVSYTHLDVYKRQDKTARVYDMSLIAYLLDPTRTNYGYLYLTERFSVPGIASGSVDVECVSMVKALLAMNEVACESARRCV